MTQISANDLEKLVRLVREAAERLTPQAVQQLIGHPSVVHSALAVAAHTLEANRESAPTNGTEIESVGSAEPAARIASRAARRRLSAHTQAGRAVELLNADRLAVLAGVKTRQTIHDWLKKGRIIGWAGAKRGLVFPAEQLDERGLPPPDLDQVLPFFADHYSAWLWLTTPLPALDGQTPLQRLRAGDSKRVVAAAAGQRQGDFA